MFSYDFSKVKDEGYELMEPGWYPFRIVEIEQRKSSKGDPMVKVVASSIDPETRGKQIWHYVVFIPEERKGAGIAKHFVKSIGEPIDSTVNPDNWIGRTFMGKVVIDEYKGKRNNKIAEVSPSNDSVSTPEEEDPFKD